MAIKKLQNDYTTPEQSKRLLELGMPADSANYFFVSFEQGELSQPHMLYGLLYSKRVPSGYEKNYLPCWSVGRLMEIYDICRCYDGDWDEVCGKETYIETYVSAIEEAVLDDMFDFSKLEDKL